MGKINKGILLPLLAAIASFIKELTGYEVPDEYLNVAADLILWLVMFLGILISPKRKEESQHVPNDTNEFAGLDEEHKASV